MVKSPEQVFFGDAVELGDISSDLNPSPFGPRVRVFTPTVASLDINLPDATSLEPGGPYFFFLSEALSGSGETITIKDADGTSLDTIPPQEVAEVWLVANGSSAGTWAISVRAYGTIPAAPAADSVYVLAGGGTATTDVDRSRSWDSDSDSWSDRQDLPDTGFSAGPPAFGILDDAFISNGELSSDKDFYRFDTSGDSFTQKGDTNDRYGASSGISGAIGTADSPSDTTGGWFFASTDDAAQAEEYDNSSETWATRTDITSNRRSANTTAYSGTIYMIGGGTFAETASSSRTKRVISTDTQSAISTAPPEDIAMSGVALVGMDMLFIGGRLSSGSTDAVRKFDLMSETYTTEVDYPASTIRRNGGYGFAAVAFSCGGLDNVTNEDRADTYDFAGWTSQTDMPDPPIDSKNNPITYSTIGAVAP